MNVEKLSLIGRKQFKYNDDIIINIPTVRQIRDEDYEGISFWKETNLFTQTPSDIISELDSVNVDFEEISIKSLLVALLTFSFLGFGGSTPRVPRYAATILPLSKYIFQYILSNKLYKRFLNI